MASINLPYIAQSASGPVHLDMSLNRAKFNELTADLVERMAGPVRQALSDAGIAASELGMVLLVGGSTRIPAVQEKVRALTGKNPSKSINPDECVAQGAAIQANSLAGNNSLMDASGNGILLLDVCPLSLSIETVGGVATRLIERNTTLPTRYSQVFTTAAPYQTSVEVHVLQGERPMARDNKTIGKFRLNGIKRAMAGVPQIEVTFDIDVNGIVTVSAKDLDTGREQSITITANDKMSDTEIEQAIRDAEQYAAQDGIRREAMEVSREAQTILSRADRALGVAGKQLDKQEKKQVKADSAELSKLLSKLKLDKVTEEQLSEIRASAARLESSSANVCRVFDEMDGQNG